jgi:hypothetical protein
MKTTLLSPLLAAGLIAISTAASAATGNIVVAGTANIFAAGQSSSGAIGSDGIVPPFISLANGSTQISFSSVTGVVHIGDPGNPAYGPESSNFQPVGYIGAPTLPVSDTKIDRTGTSLWAVFLDDTTPTGAHPTASLDFSSGGLGIAFTSLSPLLRQTFFVGDGLTGTGSGSQQTFLVPTGATRLFLGVLDGTVPNAAPGAAYFNNTGAFTVAYDLTTPVPEPETYALMLAGLGLVGFAARRRAA